MGPEKSPPRGGKIKALRIDLICEGIRNGLSYDEIQSRLNDPSHRLCDFRGECSVFNVKRVISQLPLAQYHITSIVEIEQFNYKDEVKKHDLELITSDPNIGIIGIQIKSSITGVLNFYQHFNQDLDTAKEMLLQNKLIVLNGSLEDSCIKKNFLSQFQNIYRHFKYESNN